MAGGQSAVSFLTSAVEFEAYRIQLKSVPCPHCHAVGYLIRHGYLYGYNDGKPEKEVRGWRIFCSNRYRRNGCGHTHSILQSQWIRHRCVKANRLWNLLKAILGGLSVHAAWQKARGRISIKCGYRLWKAFLSSQSAIRTLLCRKNQPKPLSEQKPCLQTIVHLRDTFISSECPISAFQEYFQRGFLQFG